MSTIHTNDYKFLIHLKIKLEVELSVKTKTGKMHNIIVVIFHDFRIKTMFVSSLPPIVCKRAHVVFMLFVFVCI